MKSLKKIIIGFAAATVLLVGAIAVAAVLTLPTTGGLGGESDVVAADPANNLVYLGQEDRLLVFDVSVSDAPVMLGQLPMGDDVMDLALYNDGVNDYVVVAAGSAGLVVVNVDTPAAPALTDTYNTIGIAQGVAIEGDIAVVADGANGVSFIDLTNPASLGHLSNIPTATAAKDVAVAVGFAYAVSLNAVHVIDFNDTATPTTPMDLGPIGVAENRYGVATNGTELCVATDEGVDVYDLFDPAAPSLNGTTPLVAVSDVDMDATYIYAATSDGLKIYDLAALSEQNTDRYPAEAPIADETPVVMGLSVDSGGNLAYLAMGLDGLLVVDLGLVSAPQDEGVFSMPNASWELALSGNMACVLDFEAPGEVHVLDVTDQNKAVAVSRLPLVLDPSEDLLWDVVMSGIYAIVTRTNISTGSHLHVFDLTDPASPVAVRTYDVAAGSGGDAFYLEAVGDVLYVLKSNGLMLLDIPELLALNDPFLAEETGFSPLGVAVSGGYAYVAADSDGLYVFDVTVPSAMGAAVGTVPTGSAAWDVVVKGGYVYVGLFDGTLEAMSLAAPDQPVFAGSAQTIAGGIQRLGLLGNYIVAVGQNDQIHVFNIESPASPLYANSFATQGSASDVLVSGDNVLVADDIQGYGVYDGTSLTAMAPGTSVPDAGGVGTGGTGSGTSSGGGGGGGGCAMNPGSGLSLDMLMLVGILPLLRLVRIRREQ